MPPSSAKKNTIHVYFYANFRYAKLNRANLKNDYSDFTTIYFLNSVLSLLTRCLGRQIKLEYNLKTIIFLYMRPELFRRLKSSKGCRHESFKFLSSTQRDCCKY